MVLAGVAALALAALTGLAAAKTASTLSVAKNAQVGGKHESIAVNARGLAVYELIPETTHHPLCTKANTCFGFWFPVKVKSASTKLSAPGIKGKLGTFHRDGFFQLTLAGHPLYTFFEDNKKGVANGDKIASFGGVWHVVPASSTSKSKNTPTSPTTSTPTNPYPVY